MPNFKQTNSFFIIVIVFMISGKILFSFSLLWLFIPVFVYSVLLFFGSKNICLQFYVKTKCSDFKESKTYLTFDDGPHPEITPQILDILKKYNQKATFFCIGKNIEQYPEISKQIHDEGHTIGNHSFSHSFYFDFFRTKKVIAELEKTNTLIKNITGKECKIFRPPYGVTNPNIAKAVKKLNLQLIGWKIRSLDTVKNKKTVLKRLEKAKPGDIILFHDTKKHTPEILDEFLRSYIQN